jgi:glycosyltransferase involved in cell wall biosynthesis
MTSDYRQLAKTVSVVMPAYNEAANLEAVVRRCAETLRSLGLKGEVVVADDGSRDATRDILQSLQAEIPELVAVHHETNQGYGAALSSAIQAARGDLLVTLDSDGQFDIGELPLLLDLHLQGHPVVAGFRKKKRDSWPKVLANKCLALLTNALFGLGLRDSNCAFKLYEGDLVRGLTIEAMGYPTPTEIMIKLKARGCRFAEVGITHYPREKGRSALGTVRTSLNMLRFFRYLKVKERLARRRIIRAL